MKTPATLNSEIAVARMINRHVKSGWHGLVDGVITKWEPFGAGMTDVLVRDVSNGHEAWYASHGLTPIDNKGPLPSRAEVRELRRHETEEALEKIRGQHVRDKKPWPGAEFGKAILGQSIDQALKEVRSKRSHSKIAKDLEAAVHAAQLYIGKGLTMRITDEQKLYNAMNRKIAAVAKHRGMDEAEAYRQIMGEAKRRGGITAMPGKDI